jgi:hypothetical protein
MLRTGGGEKRQATLIAICVVLAMRFHSPGRRPGSQPTYSGRMLPALQRLGVEGGPPRSIQEFELPVVIRG